MSSQPSVVGIIANPAAGKDIRRLVAQGRFVSNQEKVNILRRVLAGLDSVGVNRAFFMPDISALGRGALGGSTTNIKAEFLDMPVANKEIDSTLAAEVMVQKGVRCIVTLGGDGTNRAVAKGSGNVPLVPISTGTNNVFPQMTEGTVAGIAAGVVAMGVVDSNSVTRRSTVLQVWVDDSLRDIALIDVAISSHRFVGARAIWDIDTIQELVLARTDAASIGLSAIGARLRPFSGNDHSALWIKLGNGGTTVNAPVAPGVVESVSVAEWSVVPQGGAVTINSAPCTIALDGERTFSLKAGETAQVILSADGPPVVLVDRALREATQAGVFQAKS